MTTRVHILSTFGLNQIKHLVPLRMCSLTVTGHVISLQKVRLFDFFSFIHFAITCQWYYFKVKEFRDHYSLTTKGQNVQYYRVGSAGAERSTKLSAVTTKPPLFLTLAQKLCVRSLMTLVSTVQQL